MRRQLAALALIAAFGVMVAACGGGGGGGGGEDANSAPIANSGLGKTVSIGTLVTLDGSGSSDADGDKLTFEWSLPTKPATSTATLSAVNIAKPTFTADVPGTYTASLVVSDGQTRSAPSTVSITATDGNSVPVANAGPTQSVIVPITVTLDGSASADADGDALTYSWTLQSKPAGSSAALAGSTSAKPTFAVDVAGAYVASLVVNDGRATSAPSRVTVTASIGNGPPVANAGPAQSVTIPVTVKLNGAASYDPNGDALSYSWTLTSKPMGSTATLVGPDTANPTLNPDLPGQYLVTLVVSDGTLGSIPSTVTITAATANAAPIADAGPAQNVAAGSTVTLDGSGSSDANNDTLAYSWTITSKPAESAAAISGPADVKPTFTADRPGLYVLSLIVNDGTLSSSPSTVSITAVDPNKVGVPYVARNGLTVTLITFSTQNLGNGYTRYTASYKQENNTAAAVEEGTLKLYFTNAEALPQYGFFDTVLPGAAFAVTRTYSFDVLSSSIPLLLQYDGDHFFAADPIPGALQWWFPIQVATPVTIEFSMIVTETMTLPPIAQVGDIITGSFTFDAATPDTSPHPQVGEYSLLSMTVNYSGITATATTGTITITNDLDDGWGVHDGYGVGASFSPQSPYPTLSEAFIFFRDTTSTMVSSDALPLTPPVTSGLTGSLHVNAGGGGVWPATGIDTLELSLPD